MSSNQKKAVIFEVAHLPNIQEKLSIIKEKLELLGYRVIWQNAQPYTSSCMVKDAKIVFAVDKPLTAHLNEIKSDYEALGAKVEIIKVPELNVAIEKLKKHAEDRIKQEEKEEASLFSSFKHPEPNKESEKTDTKEPEKIEIKEQPKKGKSPGRPRKNF